MVSVTPARFSLGQTLHKQRMKLIIKEDVYSVYVDVLSLVVYFLKYTKR